MNLNKIKYLELCSKYNSQNGGAIETDKKFTDILDFLEKSPINLIKTDLFEMMKVWGGGCDNIFKVPDQNKKFIGSGKFSQVYVPPNNMKTVMMEDHKVNIPVVIKDLKSRLDTAMQMVVVDKILYITGWFTLATEYLILLFVRKLWSRTVNLPLILGYGICRGKTVDKLLLMRYGLKDEYKLDLSDKLYSDAKLFKSHQNTVFKSYFTNLADLLVYLHYRQTGTTLVLPNQNKCNIVELIDYIYFSYLVTHQLLCNHQIYMYDSRPENIFLHWLDDHSYYNGKCIKNVKYIVYKVGEKYYRMKTHGLIIIMGDLGLASVKVRDDIILSGHVWNIRENHKLLKERLDPKYTNVDFMLSVSDMISHDNLKNTVANTILSNEPYSSVPHKTRYFLGVDRWFLAKLKTTLELISQFDKYCVENPTESDDTIIIEIQ